MQLMFLRRAERSDLVDPDESEEDMHSTYNKIMSYIKEGMTILERNHLTPLVVKMDPDTLQKMLE